MIFLFFFSFLQDEGIIDRTPIFSKVLFQVLCVFCDYHCIYIKIESLSFFLFSSFFVVLYLWIYILGCKYLCLYIYVIFLFIHLSQLHSTFVWLYFLYLWNSYRYEYGETQNNMEGIKVLFFSLIFLCL